MKHNQSGNFCQDWNFNSFLILFTILHYHFLELFLNYEIQLMGFKLQVSFLIITIFLTSCSTINFIEQPDYSQRDYQVFNRYGSEYSSTIYLLDESEIKTDYVFAKDSLVYYAFQTDTLFIQQSEIEKIEIKAVGNKIANGLLWGIASFAGSLGLTAILLPSDSDGGAIIVLLPILVIILFSSISGYVYGDKEYIFNDKANYEQIEYYKRRAKRDSTNSRD